MTASFQQPNPTQNPEFSAPERPQTIPHAGRGHYQEWLDSQVSDSLLAANEILPLEGDAVYEKLLAFHDSERRNDGRLTDREIDRYEQVADGGWWFGTVSVRTGELTGYGCFKPDHPRENPESGHPIKYESPLGAKPELLAFQIPRSIWQKISDRYLVPIGDYTNFYQWVFDHPQIPLFLTEGAKKVGCFLSLGYAAVGVAGVTHCYSTDETGKRVLHPDLAYLVNGTRSIYFAFDFDSDKKTQKTVHNIIRKTAGLLKTHNPNCRLFKVTWNGAKGVDDWLKLNSPEAFATQVKRAKQVFPIAPDYEKQRPCQPSRTDQKFEFIRQSLGPVRFNQMTRSLEIAGEPVTDLDLLYLSPPLRQAPFEIGKGFARDAALALGKENPYHPVQDYLDSLADVEPLPAHDWDNIAHFCLGVSDPLSQIILKRFLIFAVARIYNPACPGRLVPILKGPQNIGKSSFWRILAGDEFFTDSLGSLANLKDDFMTLHASWICEWGEIDRITRKREAEEIKCFLTKTTDAFRPPYGRTVELFPRRTVIVGSTNRDDFLKDATGNTRYGIIEVEGDIDLEKLRAHRDRILATARQAYLAGESWFLSPEEQAQSEPNNNRYREQDPWEDEIATYLEGKSLTCPKDLAENCLKIEIGRHSVHENRRLADILRCLGWEQDKNKTRHPQWGFVRLWRLPECTTVPLDSPPVVQPVVQAEPLDNYSFQPTCTTEPLKNQEQIQGDVLTTTKEVSVDGGEQPLSESTKTSGSSGSVVQPATNPVPEGILSVPLNSVVSGTGFQFSGTNSQFGHYGHCVSTRRKIASDRPV